MHVTRLVCLLPLVLAGGAAFAQSGERPNSPGPAVSAPAQKSPEDIQAIKERVADWLKTCLADWDQATHMTKNEWRATCLRVSVDRGKFLLENPTMEPLARNDSNTRRR